MTVIVVEYNMLAANCRKSPYAIIAKTCCMRGHNCLLRHRDTPERLVVAIACIRGERIARVGFY